MIYGMYLSAQGAEAQSFRQDIISNNLANASTNGFKRSLAICQAHHPHDVEHGIDVPLPGDVNRQAGGIAVTEVITDYANGTLERTGGKFDVALAGPGFLRVTDGKQEFLTRDGKLDIDQQGTVVTHGQRLAVLGTTGAPLSMVPEGGPPEISSEGIITQDGGKITVGQLALAEPANYRGLIKVGQNMYRSPGPTPPAGPQVQVRQGHLESSGVRPVLEMMDLIESSRVFEANVNMIRTQDESLDRLITSLPRK